LSAEVLDEIASTVQTISTLRHDIDSINAIIATMKKDLAAKVIESQKQQRIAKEALAKIEKVQNYWNPRSVFVLFVGSVLIGFIHGKSS